MRKVMLFAAMVLVVGVAASLSVASATATSTTSSWYTVSVKLVPGHPLGLEAKVVNMGTITHTAGVVVSLTGSKFFGTTPSFTVKLKPGETWRWAWTIPAPKGLYVAKIVARHSFEANDPLDLLGATASATSSAIVQ